MQYWKNDLQWNFEISAQTIENNLSFLLFNDEYKWMQYENDWWDKMVFQVTRIEY